MDMSNPLTVVGIVLTAFIVLMVLSVVLEFLSHPIRFLAKIVLKIAGILFVILAMFQIADLINNKGVKWDAWQSWSAAPGRRTVRVADCASEHARTPRHGTRGHREKQNAEHEKWKRYQDERHDWEWERDRTIWKDGNEE